MTKAAYLNKAALLGALTLTLAARPAQAQATLALSVPVGTYSLHDVVPVTLFLAGGVMVDSYTTLVSIDTQYLQFVNTSAPFTPSTAGQAAFSSQLGTPYEASQPGILNVSYGTFNAPSGTSTLPLGTFSVEVMAALPVGGTVVSLSAPSGLNSDLPSNVHNANLGSNANELVGVTNASIVGAPASAPEPSGFVTLVLGAVLLGSAGWRARKRAQAARDKL